MTPHGFIFCLWIHSSFFPGSSDGKESACNAGNLDLILGQEQEKEWLPTPTLFCLENPMDRKAWWATVYSLAESDTTEHLTLSLLVSSASLSSVLCPTSHPPEAGGGLEASAGQLQAGLVVKNLPASAGDVKMRGSIPGSGRPPGGGHGNPPQYPYLQNPTDSGAW